jgi:hypothetical protein
MGIFNNITDNTRDDVGNSDDDLDSYFGKSDEERATDVSDTTDGSDTYVCGGWDEPNYISSDHAYNRDLSECQLDVEPPSEWEEGSDERYTLHWNSTSATWIPLIVRMQKCAWPRQGSGAKCFVMGWVMIPTTLMTE